MGMYRAARRVPLCVVVIVALGMVGGTTTAFGAEIDPTPERGLCKLATGEGEFTEEACETPGVKAGKGKEFAWVPQKEAAYTSTDGSSTIKYFTPEGVEFPPIECKKTKGKGKVTATGSTKTVLTFEECGTAGETCTGGKGATAGKIITFELTGTLGLVNDGESDQDIVGEALTGAGPEGKAAEFKCGANAEEWAGSLIGVISKVEGKPSTTNTLTFAEGAPGHQAVESFEGGPSETFKVEINGLGGGTFPFSMVLISTMTEKGPSGIIRA